MSSIDTLFRPFSLGKLNLPNRIVMAPMTRSHSPNQVPGQDVADYYRRRAEAEVGLIITEGTTIDHDVASNDPNVPAFHGEASLAGWANVVKEVHSVGGKIMPQLWHVGTMRKQGTGPHPEPQSAGPSGLFKPGKKVAEPMTQADVEHVIGAFAKGAADAQRLGFDGIEIHGAHGYIIDQFFWDGTNERTDAFGGALPERTRFAQEIIKACRAATSPDFPIILRFSQWKQQDYDACLAPTPAELEAFLAPLSDAGVDIFHCSTRRFWEPEFDGSNMNLAGWTRKLMGKPTISVGSVSLDQEFIASFAGVEASNDAGHMDDLLERMAADEFDLIAVGRALISDHEWATKIHQGRFDDLNAFSKDALAKYY
ncbi:NADH:flavin oxidoreductase [Pyruvatibacter sp.]|uniref:NADH:flavin oxidoreductase n=1 Tax=Pyruvatibacter sp. TaxID=1981328 RepID=UPI0032F06078